MLSPCASRLSLLANVSAASPISPSDPGDILDMFGIEDPNDDGTGGDDALDILHEGFIKVFRNIGKYQPGTSLSAWIRRIMVNTAIDYYRKSVRRRTEDIEQAFQVHSGDPDAVSQCTEKEILAAVQELSPAYRAVFNLYVIEGYSHKEIADALHITESTSRSNLVKARTKLKEALATRY